MERSGPDCSCIAQALHDVFGNLSSLMQHYESHRSLNHAICLYTHYKRCHASTCTYIYDTFEKPNPAS